MVTLQERLHSTIDAYEAKDFSFLLKGLEGISENQLQKHYGLYEAYIEKVNDLLDLQRTVNKYDANHNFSEYREILVELTHNLNAVILHELYFSNLINKETSPHLDFKAVINRDFSTWDHYIEDIKAVSKCARGWSITAYNYRDGKIHNFAIDGHNLNVPVFVRPLLVLDMWEHAYMIDFQTNKTEYIDVIFDNINWSVVSQRFEAALKAESFIKQSE